MKKSYNAPKIEVTEIVECDMICASASFGDSTTDTMNAPQIDFEDVMNDLGGNITADGDLKFNWE